VRENRLKNIYTLKKEAVASVSDVVDEKQGNIGVLVCVLCLGNGHVSSETYLKQ
jgi:hypothetical protein